MCIHRGLQRLRAALSKGWCTSGVLGRACCSRCSRPGMRHSAGSAPLDRKCSMYLRRLGTRDEGAPMVLGFWGSVVGHAALQNTVREPQEVHQMRFTPGRELKTGVGLRVRTRWPLSG